MSIEQTHLLYLLNRVVQHPGYSDLEPVLRHDLRNYRTIVELSEEMKWAYPGAEQIVSSDHLRRIQSFVRQIQVRLDGNSSWETEVQGQEVLDVGASIENLFPLLRRTTPHRIRMEYRTEPDQWVRGSCITLDRILINLILNARHAIRDAGLIRLQATRSFSPNGEYTIEILVSDDGRGMSPKRLAQVQSTDLVEDENGHGVGLNSTRTLVESLGGRLSLQSQEGIGTQALVQLPGLAEASGAPEPDSPSQGSALHLPGSQISDGLSSPWTQSQVGVAR